MPRLILFFFVCFPLLLLAQKKREIRIEYANDVFAARDWYYTQGMMGEYIGPRIGKSPFARLLFILPKTESPQFGIAYKNFSYTPRNLRIPIIQYQDRPYASASYISHFARSYREDLRLKVRSDFYLGYMGPYLYAGEVQTWVHTWANGYEPRGWQFQIESDLVAGYRMEADKLLWGWDEEVQVSAIGALELGTLHSRVQAGAKIRLGQSSYFQPKKVGVWTEASFQSIFVGYNATMQGGFLNPNSPHTFSREKIEPWVHQASVGFHLDFSQFFLELTYFWISKEFEVGTKHYWGSVAIGGRF